MRALPGRRRALSAALLVMFLPWPVLAQPAPVAPLPQGGAPSPAAPAAGSGVASPQPAGGAPSAAAEEAPVSEATRQEARLHFEKGIALLREEAWGAALAEFLLSRKLFPTRVATNNAAIAMRKLMRYDEALEMFESFLRDFNVPVAERAEALRDIAELRALVGTVDITGAEPGASVVVSGEERGQYPPVKPIRVAAGSHVIRVYKEGYEPFETRIDIAGGQVVTVEAKLRKITRSGKLRVVEGTGKAVDVLVDNFVVGQTPWMGTLPTGSRMVMLRGEGKLGTQPTQADVKPQELTTLSLLAEELDASLRVDPTPPGASVWINSVNVGSGVWLGRLKTGKHLVEVRADGFVTASRTVTLEKGERELVALQLERDDDAAVWRKPPKVVFDLSASFLVAPTFGGDIAQSCGSGCSASVGLGGLALVHGAYELGSGIGVGLEAGGLVAAQSIEARAAKLTPNGFAAHSQGTADEELRMSGFLVGPTLGYRFGERFPALLRVGAGVFLGEVRDERTGTFPVQRAENRAFDADPLADFAGATYFFVDPEARFGVRLTEHIEVSAGLKLLMLVALNQPRWNKSLEIGADADGIGTYPDESVAGSFVLMVAPGASVRYDF
jgi:PEGA domain